MDEDKELLELQYEYSNMFEEYDLNKFPEFWFEVEDNELKKRVLKRAIKEKNTLLM